MNEYERDAVYGPPVAVPSRDRPRVTVVVWPGTASAERIALGDLPITLTCTAGAGRRWLRPLICRDDDALLAIGFPPGMTEGVELAAAHYGKPLFTNPMTLLYWWSQLKLDTKEAAA